MAPPPLPVARDFGRRAPHSPNSRNSVPGSGTGPDNRKPKTEEEEEGEEGEEEKNSHAKPNLVSAATDGPGLARLGEAGARVESLQAYVRQSGAAVPQCPPNTLNLAKAIRLTRHESRIWGTLVDDDTYWARPKVG